MGPSGLFGNTPTPGIGMGGGAMGAGSPATIGSMAGTSGVGMGGGLPMAAGFGGGSMAPQAPQQAQPTPEVPTQEMQRQMQQQQRAMSPLMQQQMMRQQQFNPFQQQQMMRQQPFQQQQMMRQQPFQQQQMGGLQAALMQLLGQYNQPMQRQQFMPMPQYQNQALQYRPDMTQAQESLSRVAPSVQEQQRLAEEAAAEKARSSMFGTADEDADFQAWQRQQYENSKYLSQQG
jgi:hypothetical protein